MLRTFSYSGPSYRRHPVHRTLTIIGNGFPNNMILKFQDRQDP